MIIDFKNIEPLKYFAIVPLVPQSKMLIERKSIG